jgi:hypothetical protein
MRKPIIFYGMEAHMIKRPLISHIGGGRHTALEFCKEKNLDMIAPIK